MPTPTRYVTVVLELPATPAAKKSVLEALPLLGHIQEARITGMYAGDAITENELLEKFVHPREVRLIREETRHDHPLQMTIEA
ncbi:MAG: hypothetical protein ACREPQ_00665 [Rhodanobacter sp.]